MIISNSEKLEKKIILIYPAAETAGNLMQGNYFIFIRSLTPWQDHGEYARYPFKSEEPCVRLAEEGKKWDDCIIGREIQEAYIENPDVHT